MFFLWYSYGFPMVPLSVPMVFLWYSFGSPMVLLRFSSVFLWHSYNIPLHFLRFSQVFLWFFFVCLGFSYCFDGDAIPEGLFFCTIIVLLVLGWNLPTSEEVIKWNTYQRLVPQQKNPLGSCSGVFLDSFAYLYPSGEGCFVHCVQSLSCTFDLSG